MKKKLKIFFVICLLLIVTGFNSLKVSADSQTLCPIIFDGYKYTWCFVERFESFPHHKKYLTFYISYQLHNVWDHEKLKDR